MNEILDNINLPAVFVWLVTVGIPLGWAVWEKFKKKEYSEALDVVVEAIERQDAKNVKETVATLSANRNIQKFVSTQVEKITTK